VRRAGLHAPSVDGVRDAADEWADEQ
jgi:hypothetical protein